ncbi:hypothetical protein TYRP_006612 [Tyrophagus putrescentiae]|nr:hypothetical protein TYRP_006612 [Tyrophagus putrescentiae]
MNNRDEENSPFNFGNSFDGQTTFEKQKATLMQEFEQKLAELRANNKQELANAVMELKHQLTGLGKTLLLGQTQQGLLLSAAAAANRQRKPEPNAGAAAAVVEVATIASRSVSDDDDERIHQSLLTKLEALSQNFTRLTSNYRNALQESVDQAQSLSGSKNKQQKETKKKKQKQQMKSKWKNDYGLDSSNSFYDLDSQLGVKTLAKKSKKKNKQGKQWLFKPKKPIKVLEKPANHRAVYPVPEEPPPFYDNRPRQIPAVERSMVEDQGGAGGGDQDQLGTNKYIYYVAAGALAVFGYCCFAMNSVEDVNLANQEKHLQKKQRERARREKRRRRKLGKKRKRSKDSEDDEDEDGERRPFSKYKQKKPRQRKRRRHSKTSMSTSRDRSLSGSADGIHQGPLNSVHIGSLKQQGQQQQPASQIPPVVLRCAAAADQTATEPVIVLEADQVHQFFGAHSDMATQLEAMMRDFRRIPQTMIETEQQHPQQQSGPSSAEAAAENQQQQQHVEKQSTTSAPSPPPTKAPTTSSNNPPNSASSQEDTSGTPVESPVTSMNSRNNSSSNSSVVTSAQQVLFQRKSAVAAAAQQQQKDA